MKILLIRPNPSKKSIGLHDIMICEPIELEYVAAYLKEKGHVVYLKDMILEKEGLKQILSKIEPDMVGFTSYITHTNVIKQYAREVKQYNKQMVTFVGGVHSEVVPEDYKDENIDYVLGKNGIKNLGILCTAIIEYNKPIFESDQIDKSFNIPFPDREITKEYRARYDYAFHAPCALLKTSYGCPYQCKFCFCVEITSHSYYERSMEDVVRELKGIKEPNIFIVDDNFFVDKERVSRFCSLIKENKINKKYIVFGRADFIVENEETINKFKDCGLEAVFVGIESFKQEELNIFNKRINIETNEKAINILHANRIDCYAGIIVGPDWSVRDFKTFSNWMVKMNIMFANIQPLVPLPGTPMFRAYEDQLLFGRDECEKWDLTHIVIKPTKMTVARYYFEIIRAYFRSTSSLRTYLYVRKNYGKKMANKCFWGAISILRQYLLLIVQSLLNEKNIIHSTDNIQR